MPGYSPFLPLTFDPTDGILLNKSYAAVAKQNFKMLLLTVPGEKIMDPTFGIGLQKMFFENISLETSRKVETRIKEQTRKYLPYIHILHLDVNSDVNRTNDTNTISVYIKYEIHPLNLLDAILVEFNLSPDLF